MFAAIAAIGALAYIRGGHPAGRPQMDWPGAVLAGTGLFAIVYGCSHAVTAGWTAALTLVSLIAGVLLLAGFVLAEQRVRHPLLPMRVILDRARGGSYVALGISGMAIFGTFLFLTFYLQVVRGDRPFTTGLLFLPMIGCILLSSNLSSFVRLGPRTLIAAGMLLSAGGMALLTQLTVTSRYATTVLPALILLGLGLGLIFAQGINTATAGVAPQDSGVASALVNTMRQVGGSIGTAALSTIALSATGTYLAAHRTGSQAPAIAATHGYTVAFELSVWLLVLGFVLAVVLLPSRRRLAGAPRWWIPGQAQVRSNWEQIFTMVPDITAPVMRRSLADGAVWSEWEMRHATRRHRARDGRRHHLRRQRRPLFLGALLPRACREGGADVKDAVRRAVAASRARGRDPRRRRHRHARHAARPATHGTRASGARAHPRPVAGAHLAGPRVEVASGDVRDAASPPAACAGVDVAVSAVHGFGGSDVSPESVDLQGNVHLIDAAAAEAPPSCWCR